jgi:hypothetical protein
VATTPQTVATTYTTAAGGLQTLATTTNPSRLTEIGLSASASLTVPVKVTLFINTYTYLTTTLNPGSGFAVPVDAFVAGSTGVQLAVDAAGQNLVYPKLSWLDDVNSPAGGPQVVGARGYHTAGAGVAQSIWTTHANGSRLVEVALANVSTTTPYSFTLWHGTSGTPFFGPIRLDPLQAFVFSMKTLFTGGAQLALVTDAPASNTQWHVTGIDDLTNAQGAAA